MWARVDGAAGTSDDAAATAALRVGEGIQKGAGISNRQGACPDISECSRLYESRPPHITHSKTLPTSACSRVLGHLTSFFLPGFGFLNFLSAGIISLA